MEEMNFLKSFEMKSFMGPMSLSEQEQMADNFLREISKKNRGSDEYALPQHLETFRLEFENASKKMIKLPTIISQLTPRSKKKASLLPPPNRAERQHIKRIEEIKIDPGYIYQHLDKKLNTVDESLLNLDALQTNLSLPVKSEVVEVDRTSTEFYEAIGQSVRRKAEQAKKISDMFDHSTVYLHHRHKDAKPTTMKRYNSNGAGHSSSNLTDEPSKQQLYSGSAVVLPKLPMAPYSVTSELSQFVASKSVTKLHGNPLLSATAPVHSAVQSLGAPPTTQPSQQGIQPNVRVDNSQYSQLFSGASEKRRPGAKSAAKTTRKQQHQQNSSRSDHPSRVSGSVEATHESEPLLLDHSIQLPMVVASESIQTRSLAHEYSPLIRETEGLVRAVYDNYSKNRELVVRDVSRRQQSGSEREYLNQFSVDVFEQCGLDINKEYIRLRKFKSYIKLLLFYVHSFRLRAAFVHYRAQIILVRKAKLKLAAQRVYCVIKAAMYWRSLREREERRRNQLASDADLDRQQRLIREKCAVRMQHALRRFVKMKAVRRRLRQRRAATTIQKRVRGCSGRQRAHAVLLMHQFIFRNATIIQAACRRRLATRKVILLRKLEFVRRWLEHVQQTKLATQQSLYLNGAEAFIAKAYRTYQIRKKLKRIVYWNHFEKAIVLQRFFRGYRVRKITSKALKAARVRRKLEQLSALRLQRLVRGFVARKRFKKLVKQRKQAKKLRMEAKLRRMAMVSVKQLNPLQKLMDLLRRVAPFPHIRLNKKAIAIQRVYRGHHGRRRFFIVRIQRAIFLINKRFRLQTRSATRIQKFFRGWKCRHNIKTRKMARMIVRIQCIWRLHKSCRRVMRLKKLHRDASTLTLLLFRICKRHKFRVRHRRLLRLQKFVLRMQCFARRFLAKRRVCRVKTRLRSECELEDFLFCRENDLLSMVQLRVLADSMGRTIGQKNMSQCFSNVECTCFGPVQAMFVHAVCSKGKTDALLLGTNKADSNAVSKFVHRVNELMVNGSEANKNLRQLRKLNSVATINRTVLKDQFHLAMLDMVDRGHWVLPESRTKLTGNEVDILFSKAISDRAAGTVLTYADFQEFLFKVAQIHYADRTVSLSAAMLLMGGADDVAYDPSAPLNPPTSSSAESTGRPQSPGTDMSGMKVGVKHTLHKALDKHSRHKTLSLELLKYNPFELLAGPNTDFRVALVIQIFLSLRNEAWMQPVLQWLDRESRARVSVFVVRIQNMVRIRQAVFVKAQLLKKKQAADAFYRRSRFAVLCQSVIRRYVHRNRVARIAQRQIFEYVPNLGDPYWFNPKTQTKSWVKPKVLRNLQCFSVALPEEGLENVIQCCYCSKSAEVNCMSCEDSMCRVCFNSMHCKGNRRHHCSEKIPTCSYCKYQVATKSCLTCVLKVPARDDIRYEMKQSERGHYCDTCFAHEHDLGEKILDRQADRKKGLKILLAHSHEAYLIKQYIHKKIVTNHRYDQLVQPCEECHCRSSTWRCTDCQQVYCNKCLVGLHSMGGAFARHNAELLPYYTIDMHISLQKDFTAQEVQRKLEKLSRVAAQQREEQAYFSAIRLQSWWRMHYYGKIGRKAMKKARKLLRIAYRARKKETREIRSTLGYRIANAFSCAPALRTDTREEAALRTVNIFKRQRAREYIWKNLEDWGHFPSAEMRKGVPKRGFAVGTIEELIGQARLGGNRLPGRILVVPNEQLFESTCDLTSFLRPGEYVRIQNRLFGVVKIQPDCIKLNRKWRGSSPDAGEVLYRMPTYLNEPGQLSFRVKYLSYDLTVGNPLVQAYFLAHRFVCLRMVRYCIYMVKMTKKSATPEDAAEWRQSAERYAESATWAGSYLSTGDAMVDLSQLQMPEPGDDKSARKGRRRRDSFDDEEGSEGDNWYDDGGLLDDEPRSSTRKKPYSSSSRRGSRRSSTVYADGEGDFEADEDDAFGEADEEFDESRPGSRSKPSSRPTSEQKARQSTRPSSKDSKDSSRAMSPAAGITKLPGKRNKKKTKDSGRPAGVPWYATVEETMARREREDKMTPQELALEAGEWKECIDIMTENIYYQNIHTFEMLTTVPRSVAAKRQLEFENSKNKKNYDEAQKRIQRFELVTKNRLLITGGRKK